MTQWYPVQRELTYTASRHDYVSLGPQARPFRTFYVKLFPFELLCSWLSYGNTEKLLHREFAYTLTNDIFVHHKNYANCKDMRYEICCVGPMKIDIGSIFDRPTNVDTTKINPIPIEKELVFDIDLSDYNNIRTCCTETRICGKCWKYAAVACKILDASLREDFGWRNILWVFSGRRGIHCWVCDSDARSLDARERRCIVKYYTMKRAGSATYLPIELGMSENLPILIKRSYKIAMDYFVPVCIDEQNLLMTPENEAKFFSLLPESCREQTKAMFEESSTSLEKWEKFSEYWKNEEQTSSPLWKSQPHLIKEIVLYYLYPRIDAAVTEGMNHLLKAPFCCHPKTLILCIPFDPQKVDEFTRSDVPTLVKLLLAHGGRTEGWTMSSADENELERYDESLQVMRTFLKSFDNPIAEEKR